MEHATLSQTMTPPMSSTALSSPRPDLPAGVFLFDSPSGTLDTSTTLHPSLEDFISSLPMTSSFSLPVTLGENHPTHPAFPEYIYEGCTVGSSIINQDDVSLQSSEGSSSAYNETGRDRLEFGPSSLTYTFPTAELSQQLGDAQNITSSQHTGGLQLALKLMAQLSFQEEDSPLSASSTTTGYEHLAATPASQLQTVIEKNKKVMEMVSSMLQPTSCQDGYCLVVVCLVVSKVLSTYAAAAHGSFAHENSQQRLGTSTSSTLSAWSAATTEPALSGPLQTERTDPVTAQLVLDELYKVQASVEQLGAKMQHCAKRNRIFSSDPFPTENNATLPAFPFSVTVSDQLYTELRKRLSILSLELIDELKRYWA